MVAAAVPAAGSLTLASRSKPAPDSWRDGLPPVRAPRRSPLPCAIPYFCEGLRLPLRIGSSNPCRPVDWSNLSRATFHWESASAARGLLRLAASVVLASLAPVRADDSPPAAATNAAPTAWTFRPIVLTNEAPAPFLQNQAGLAPQEGDHPGFPFGSGEATNAPGLIPPGPVDFSDITPQRDSANWGNDLASHLLVVYNTNDPDSKALAAYYAARRSIPAERVLGISCPTTEEITRREYEDLIRSPIVAYLHAKDWLVRAPREVPVGNRTLNLLVATRNDIWALALIRGVPLKIAEDSDDFFGMESKPELQTNAASVDSELALLPVFGLPLGGFVPNCFYDSEPGGIKNIGPELACNMVLVARLDGPTVDDVRRMIDDSLYAEKHRLAGLAVVDTRGLTDEHDGYTSGDDWLRGARDALVTEGWTVKFDAKPELIPPSDPCDQVAIYLGWYSGSAYGPYFTPPPRFVRGAVAYHLHSFSASTVRSATECWVGPLIAHGADATMGMVYEPYLALTPHEDIFARRLLAGDYFAEAAWASERGLSWMLTVVGDPLYRPFLPTIDDALAQDPPDHWTAHDDWLQLQKVRLAYEQGIIPPDPQRLVSEVEAVNVGPVAHEGLGDLLLELKDPNADTLAESEYRKAAVAEIAPIDRIRVALKLAAYYNAHGESAHAQAELDNMRDLFPNDATRFGVPNTLVPTSIPPSSAPPQPAPPSNGPARLPQLPQLPKPTPSP